MRALPRHAPGEVRIIGGIWKRSKLPVPAVEGLRPTPDRVRETLFNWLGQDLSGLQCVDLFAGSGALGLEAASRGAASVVMVERDRSLVRALGQHVQRLGAHQVQVVHADAVSWVQGAPKGWDVVFLDPPFGSPADDWNRVLCMVCLTAVTQRMRSGGQVYLESGRAWRQSDVAGLPLRLHRAGKAGMVHHHLFEVVNADAVAGDNPGA